MTDALSLFHPTVAAWFAARMGPPTPAQEGAWPSIAHGEHVLLIAPTGSGKTMAAFLWALNQVLTGGWASGQTSVLYISPLRALNNDIQRNLLLPLHELREAFGRDGREVCRVRVLTRSGDTPSAARRSMLRHPPEILITTPESLNLLLSSLRGRSALEALKVVILDEVHAVAGTKRGTYLMTAVERLVSLSGEFQRIALSATITPEQETARFVGGYVLSGLPKEPCYRPRDVAVVRPAAVRSCEITAGLPAGSHGQAEADGSFWDGVAGALSHRLSRNRSTLIFTNSRRLSERLTLAINRAADATVAYAHHGSLSREIRHDVEERLKTGELKAIVATSSLELGIDVGAIDEVVLVSTPATVSSALQRVGRSGHHVGGTSRGFVIPIHGHDLVEAAAMIPAVLSGDIEATHQVCCPLDVLAQVIVSMVSVEQWDIEELFNVLRTSQPFHGLSRTGFDLVVGMLGGRYAGTRIRELAPLVSVDPVQRSIVGQRGSLLTIYGSGGVIPDRGYFHLRRHDTGARVGELDEEFVWEAVIGQTFTLGSQMWRIERITHNDVFVAPARARAASTPFWRGEGYRRGAHLGELIGQFLEDASPRLEESDFVAMLERDRHLEPSAAEALVDYLRRQMAATGCQLPHRHHIVVEHVESGPGGGPGRQVIIHSCFGLTVNHPWALALAAAWEEQVGPAPEIYPSNDTICLVLPEETDAGRIMSLVSSDSLERHLRLRLEHSGLFVARFRECAGRALLLPRRRAGERMPLWMNRLRAQQLFEAVKDRGDFPIVLETWRTCLQDEFDLDRLRTVLDEVRDGRVRVSDARTSHPSPFARGAEWRQVNEYMYMGDVPSGSSRLRADLVEEVARAPGLRPGVPVEAVRQFVHKRQRLIPGYVPATARELVDWVRERVAIPADEWEELLRLVPGASSDGFCDALAGRLAWLSLPRGAEVMVAREEVARVSWALDVGAAARTLSGEDLSVGSLTDDSDDVLTEFLAEWLRFYGPLPRAAVAARLGVAPARTDAALHALEDDGRMVSGALIAGSEEEHVCDARNFTWLLRLLRRQASVVFRPLPADHLPVFLAAFQGLLPRRNSPDALRERLIQLQACPAAAGLWETEMLPARVGGYACAGLDGLMQEGDLRWVGCGDRCVAFIERENLDLLSDEEDEAASPSPHRHQIIEGLFVDPEATYDVSTLLRRSGGRVGELVAMLWRSAWAGAITCDSFVPLRRGVESGFELQNSSAPTGHMLRGGRGGRGRWRSALPQGNWYRIPWPDQEPDAVERQERQRARVRILLDRYGILFRELLAHELPLFRWTSVFRALRIMELAGEVVSGCFFDGIGGLQFMSPRAFAALQHGLPHDVVWVNAADPASLCGVGIEGLSLPLPRRIPGTHLVYHGMRLVMVSERGGAALRIFVSPEAADHARYLGVFSHLLTRPVQPHRRIVIESINGAPAASSPYAAWFRSLFDVAADRTAIALYRRF